MVDGTPLRIIHLVRSPVGGIFRHIVDLAGAQAAAGHEVGLVCDNLTGGVFEDAKIAALTPHLALGSVRLPIARNISPLDAVTIASVRSVLAPKKPDVIHCHGAKAGVFGRIIGAWLGRSRPVARFYVPHGGSLHYRPGTVEARIYFGVERALERVTDALIHVSAFEAATYVDKIGRPRCPAIVVRNGVTPAEFNPVTAAPGAADFLYLGMLRDLKGVDVFIEALALLAATERPASAVIVGDGPDEARYRAMVAERGLGALVSFRPSTPTREAFALGRAIVVPSRAESMPYVVLEAIAAGLPMISTDVGGIPEIFGPHSGQLIAAGDASVLASAMAATLAHPERAALEAAERRSHISNEFSLAEMSSKIETVYREAIDRRKRPD